MALRISIGDIAKRSGFFAMSVGYDGKVSIRSGLSTRTVIWWMKQRTNDKNSHIFCFKLLKDGNLLC